MATLDNAVAPRKRIATYGKAARRRIPEYQFSSFAQKSQTPEVRQSEPPSSRSPSTPPTPEPKKVKSAMRSKTPIKIPAAPPPVAANIFDVPSDEETPPSLPSAQKIPRKPAPKGRVQKATKDMFDLTKEDDESRKRVKLSPVRRPAQKPAPTKTVAKPSPPRTKALPPKQPALEKAHTAIIVARPRKAAPPRTPRKLSPVLKSAPILSTPSPPASSEDVMDVDVPGNFISPKGQQMWKDLLDPVDDEVSIPEMVIVAARKKIPSPTVHTTGTALFKPAGVVKQSNRSPRKLPRRRLIDSLVEQASHDDEMDEDSSGSGDSNTILATALESDFSFPALRGQSLTPEIQFAQPAFQSQSQSQGSQVNGPRFTYSKQRSMLAEDDFMKQLELDMPTQSAQSSLQKLQSFHEVEDEDSALGTRSVHELRQAGANSRFLDEIEDLLDRIGNPTPQPSSARRSGLLDLASKIKDKNFGRQFRSNGVETRLFVHMGRETDVVAGFIMVSILMTLLGEASILPHVVNQLRTQGVARLIIRLLESSASISLLAKDRKNNMSKVAQSLIVEYADHLLALPIWEELQPKVITPRMTALKCLELMVRQTREAGNAGDLISKELTTKLFSILETGSDESCWELPSGKDAVDFFLALSALESHSIAARTLQDENIWISNYLPIIADVLEVSLTKPADAFGVLQILFLRLTLNVTNNNSKASDVFAKSSLMSAMGQTIVKKFKKMLRFLTEEELSAAVDHIILTLGVVINFAEWSSAARESLQSLQGDSDDPLDDMVQLFVDSKESTSMAESVEETQKNVAFGYLATALGYLCLLPAIAERVRNKQPSKTIRPVTAAIEEFIGHHKTVDDLLDAEDGHSANTGLTERLESLVSKLRAMKAGGE